MGRHTKWRTATRLPADDTSVIMHEAFRKVWHTAQCYDQVDGSNFGLLGIGGPSDPAH